MARAKRGEDRSALTLEPATAPAPYKALALRRNGRSWQLVELTLQGTVVLSEKPTEPNMFPIAVGEFKAAAAKYFGEVVAE